MQIFGILMDFQRQHSAVAMQVIRHRTEWFPGRGDGGAIGMAVEKKWYFQMCVRALVCTLYLITKATVFASKHTRAVYLC